LGELEARGEEAVEYPECDTETAVPVVVQQLVASPAPQDADQMSRTYNTNIVAQRWGAVVLDLVVCLVMYLTVGLTLGDRGLWPLWLWAAAVVFYFVALEGRWGLTLGKLAMKIRVVDRSGQPPGIRRASVRMLLRLLEVNPLLLGGVPAGLVACLSKSRQRLGDMLAGTYVLYRDDALRLRAARS
jgi:uncharacterized RDD family membrane protein YckC